MSLPRQPFAPNKILLSGAKEPVENTMPAGVEIRPGMVIEQYLVSTTASWRPHTTATDIPPAYIALEQDELNLGVDDVYAINDLVKGHVLAKGDTFWGLLASGQNIQNREFLQSAGDGTLKSATATTAAAGVARFQAQEDIGLVNTLTRVKVQVV